MPKKSDTSETTGLKKSPKKTALARVKPLPLQPWSIQAQREMMLQAAGVGPGEMGEMVKQALAVLTESLGATTVRHFAHQGIVTDERELPAVDLRIKAAKQIVESADVLMNLRGEASQENPGLNKGGAGVVFHVHTTWGGPPVDGQQILNVTPDRPAIEGPVHVPWASKED